MTEQVTRAEAIETFASTLRELRESVGNPSFREMSGRSRAISHTTLHEASKGYRLPSWSTTAEFVKACGADPADYRERWDRANRATGSARPVDPAAPEGSAAPIASASLVDGTDETRGGAPSRPQGRGRRYAWTAAAAVVVAAAVTIGVVVASHGHRSGAAAGQASTAPLTATECPLHLANPPAAPVTHPGDASVFVDDITLPDCSHVKRGTTVTKVWRLKNTGTVAWVGYSLHRLELPEQRDQCQTISDVPVPTTRPGALVDIRASVTTPDNPAFCFARFKMRDAAGQVVFPGSRPVNYQLIVD